MPLPCDTIIHDVLRDFNTYDDEAKKFLIDYVDRSFRLEEKLREEKGCQPPEKPPTAIPRQKQDDRPKMVEYAPGKYRTADVVEYSHRLGPMGAFICLIYWRFIALDVETGTATQLRDFTTGRELEKPVRMEPVWKRGYLRLKAKLPCSDTKTGLADVLVRVHCLVYSQVHGGIPYGHQIHHKDGNRAHNGHANLEARTPADHHKVGKQTGAHKRPQNQSRYSRNDPVVAKIKQLRAAGLSEEKIAEQIGCSRSTCRRIILDTYPYREDDPAGSPAEDEDDRT
jgi:hypothetical protein